MVKQIIDLLQKAVSYYGRVVAFVIFGMVVGALLTSFMLPTVSIAPATESNGTQSVALVSVAEPERLRIPSVGIDTSFEGSLGLNDDQTVEVPESYEQVGWYQYAPLPGELGPAVILGHVDSFQGPAVFHPLTQTSVGDRVLIDRVDGSTATFTITKLLYRDQTNFPTEEVYGDIDHSGLRLITCSGTFDRGKQVYSHNLIVFAELTEDTAKSE